MASSARRGQEDQRPILAGQQLVDELVDGEREAQFQQPHDEGAAEVEIEEVAVGSVVGCELAQHHESLSPVYVSDFGPAIRSKNVLYHLPGYRRFSSSAPQRETSPPLSTGAFQCGGEPPGGGSSRQGADRRPPARSSAPPAGKTHLPEVLRACPEREMHPLSTNSLTAARGRRTL